MKEDKVREAIAVLNACNTKLPITTALKLLAEAIAPEQPEIPEGCPVIILPRYNGEQEQEAFKNDNNSLRLMKIDYQRKGHVIPWHGGECPVEEHEMVTVFQEGWLKGGNRYTGTAKGQSWAKVVAYVIWPEWTAKLSGVKHD